MPLRINVFIISNFIINQLMKIPNNFMPELKSKDISLLKLLNDKILSKKNKNHLK